MITVNRRYEVEWQPGTTVRDVLDALHFTFPMIVVRLEGQVIRRENFSTTPVPDGATMEAIHLTSGG